MLIGLSLGRLDRVEAQSTGLVVSAALDPVLVPLGFAAGQYSDGVESQTIFCASYDDFARRYPHLEQAAEQASGVGRCVDLVIDVDRTASICSIDLETLGLDETLRRAGLATEADDLAEALVGPLERQLESLRTVLSRLLAAVP